MSTFKDEFLNLGSLEEKDRFLADLLQFAADQVASRQASAEAAEIRKELQQKQEELDKANATIARAREFYREAKEDAATAEKRAQKEICRNLQIARDRLCAVIETAMNAGMRMEGNSRAKVTFDELNNVIFAANSVIDELQRLNLWTEADIRPEVRELKKPTASRKSKVKESNTAHVSVPGGDEQTTLSME